MTSDDGTYPAHLDDPFAEGWLPADVIQMRAPALMAMLHVDESHSYEAGTDVIRANNNRRAGWALIGFNAYSERVHGTSQEEPDTGLIDMLGDLLHLCDLLNVNFDLMVERARGHYEAELRGEL